MTRRKNYNPLLKGYPDSVLINSVSEGAEVLYVRLIAQSDDAGRYWGCPKLVAAKLFSHRFASDEVTVNDISSRITELNSAGLIATYSVKGQAYLVMVDVYKAIRKDISAVIVFPAPGKGGSGVKAYTPPHPARGGISSVVPTHTNPTHTNPTQPIKRRKRQDLTKILLEEYPELAAASGFVKAWAEWVQYRAELGKKLTASTARSQLKNKARPWGPVQFMAAMESSISMGWTGVFPPNQSQKSVPRAASAIADFLGGGNGEDNSPRVVDVE